MEVNVQIQGLENLARSSKAVRLAIEKEIAAGLFASAKKIEGDAKKSILTGQKSGRIYVRGNVTHQSSAPGQAPASDTGRLANSINGEMVKGALESIVRAGSGVVKYARMLEFGTIRMAARPFFQPAVESNRKWIMDRMKQAVQRGIQRGSRG